MVAPFVAKAYEIFGTEAFSSHCSWNEAGDTIVVKDVAKFSSEILPKFFKHSNFQSFVRQLNIVSHVGKVTKASDNISSVWVPQDRSGSITARIFSPMLQEGMHRSAQSYQEKDLRETAPKD